MQLTSIQPGNFDLVSSLQVFALTVVGGIGAVGGALFGALSLFVFLPLIVQIWPGLVRWVGLLPGLTGIGLGRNPNGAVHDIREGFLAAAARARRRSSAWSLALVVFYALRIADVIDELDPYLILSVVVAGRRDDRGRPPQAARRSRRPPAHLEAVLDVPLEWRRASTGRGTTTTSRSSTGRSASRRCRCMALLEVHGVTVRFGGNIALDDVSIDDRARHR